MTEDTASSNKTAHRAIVGGVVFAAGVIAIGLISLFVLLAAKISGSNTDHSVAGVILSLIGTFAVFFSVISIQGATFALKPRAELMSLVGWRILVATLILIGLACAVLFHWVALMLPVAMALICLLREPRVQEWLRALGI